MAPKDKEQTYFQLIRLANQREEALQRLCDDWGAQYGGVYGSRESSAGGRWGVDFGKHFSIRFPSRVRISRDTQDILLAEVVQLFGEPLRVKREGQELIYIYEEGEK